MRVPTLARRTQKRENRLRRTAANVCSIGAVFLRRHSVLKGSADVLYEGGTKYAFLLIPVLAPILVVLPYVVTNRA